MSEQNEAENQTIPEDVPIDESEQLRQRLVSCEDKLKRSLADYLNLERKTKSDIQNGINEKMDRFLLQFLTIYDDLIRAKEILKKEKSTDQKMQLLVNNIKGESFELLGSIPIGWIAATTNYPTTFGLPVFKSEITRFHGKMGENYQNPCKCQGREAKGGKSREPPRLGEHAFLALIS